MKNFVLYRGIVKDSYCLVKTVSNYENFKDIIGIFKNPPYCEILSDDDYFNEYQSYVNNGYMFGCYINNEIAGINCILNDVPCDYSICFTNKNRVAYYSGLAVKPQFRNMGLGKLLVNQTEKFLKETNDYDRSFARILCHGSMSEGIFRLNGF